MVVVEVVFSLRRRRRTRLGRDRSARNDDAGDAVSDGSFDGGFDVFGFVFEFNAG